MPTLPTVTTMPTGTVTFLFTNFTNFTNIESSTNRLQEQREQLQQPPQMQGAEAGDANAGGGDTSNNLTLYEQVLREAIHSNGGYLYKQIGTAFQAAFPTAPQAVQAALHAQCGFHSEDGELAVNMAMPMAKPVVIPVVMALHTGVTEVRGEDYFGPLLNRVSRLLAAGHGGQILLSLATAELARDHLPHGAGLRDLGEHRLRDLFRPERIYQLVVPDLPSEFPPLKTLDARPNNLPLQPTPFVGRDKEVAQVRQIICREDVRLLTLTGPGGMGKTRLALQTAADLLDEFPDGVYFVPLAAITDPSLVVSTIAHTLDVKEVGGRSVVEVLGEYLRDKRLLLVLDNFEQVLEASTGAAELLTGAPHVKVLATSRAPLHLSVEQQYPVPSLSLPPTDPGHLPSLEALSQYEAVALFISRAQAASPSFEVNNQNAPAVAEICVRLDGLPLAIELAAARIKILSPQEVLTRLQSSLKLLTGGGRDLPTRQQTLRNTIEWSYDLLSSEEKELFSRLAVFVGGSTLEAIELVCNPEATLDVDVLDSITSLVDKSLLRSELTEGQESEGVEGLGEPRFVMLETIREFAGEKLQELGELEALEKQHALYFMGLAEQAEPQLIGPKQVEWLQRLEEEHDNLRAALQWAVEKSNLHPEAAETGLRLAGGIWRFWYVRGYYREGRDRLAKILELPKEDTGQGRALLQTYRAKALHGAGVLAQAQGDYAVARLLYEESLALRRELGDERGIASLVNNLGLLAYHDGDYATARSLQEESLAIARKQGDKWGISSSLNNLGNVAYQQGDYATARTIQEESLVLKRELGDKKGLANVLDNLGLVAQEQGDCTTARAWYEEALAVRRELGDKWGIAGSLLSLGDLAYESGDYTSARSMREESLIVFRELGDKEGSGYAAHNLGLAAQEQGDYTAARSLMEEALILRREAGDKIGIAMSLAGLGGLAVSTGKVEQGTRLLGAAKGLLESIRGVLSREARQPYERALEMARSQLGEERFERLRQEGMEMKFDEAIETALEGG